MMNSLFSSFDPMSSTMSMNFMIYLSPMVVPISMWLFTLNSRITTMFSNIKLFMETELKASLNSNFLSGKMNMMLGIFLAILTLNLVGLIPYVYTLTAQLMFTLSVSLPIWMSAILFSITKNNNMFLAHMVPSGTPMALSQFMSIIETVSQIIRPITLSVRLAANMTAGHILMALSSTPILMSNHMTLVLTMLLILELAVAIIQSYVFVILITMYLSETK